MLTVYNGDEDEPIYKHTHIHTHTHWDINRAWILAQTHTVEAWGVGGTDGGRGCNLWCAHL